MAEKFFSKAVGNPPYQEQAGESRRQPAVYHHHVERAQKFAEELSLIYPARWMNGGFGRGLRAFAERELASPAYESLWDFPNSKDVFSDVSVSGGINVSHWRGSKLSPEVIFHRHSIAQERTTLSGQLPSMIRDPWAHEFYHSKLAATHSLASIVYPLAYYGGATAWAKDILKGQLPPESEGLKIYYVGEEGFATALLPSHFTSRPTEDYKVFVSKNSYSKGKVHVMGKSFVGLPGEIASVSFLKVGSFSTAEQAHNCLTYLRSVFTNWLFSLLTPTFNSKSSNYSLIPLLDFSSGEILGLGEKLEFASDIDGQLRQLLEISSSDWEKITAGLVLFPERPAD